MPKRVGDKFSDATVISGVFHRQRVVRTRTSSGILFVKTEVHTGSALDYCDRCDKNTRSMDALLARRRRRIDRESDEWLDLVAVFADAGIIVE